MEAAMAELKSRVLEIPAAKPKAAKKHFSAKLALETDASDVHEDMKNGVKGFTLLDARRPESFAREHIKGAEHFWHNEISKKSAKRLSKKQVYVVYCAGIGCNASTKAAAKLGRLGFRVKELVAGLEWWKAQGYPTVKNKKS
jgi:rhodanese-related sulfurtransferase